MRVLICIVSFLLLSFNVFATDSNIDTIRGRDSNDGRSPATAYKTPVEDREYMEPFTDAAVSIDTGGLFNSPGSDLARLAKRVPQSGSPSYILNAADVTGWVEYIPSTWQASLDAEPSYVKRDDMWLNKGFEKEGLQDNEWFWEAGLLYVKDAEGNPDAMGRRIKAVTAGDMGWSVTSGDFNGDGLSDIAIGAPLDDTVGSNAGQVYIYNGNVLFSRMPSLKLPSPAALADEQFGYYVASAGDVNGDGFDDLIVSTGWGVNRVYLFFGSPAGPEMPNTILPPPGYSEYGFGHAIGFARGDINRDGFGDILIGGGGTPAYFSLYYGSASGINGSGDAVITYPGTGSQVSLSFIGDTNKDGFDEIAVSVAMDPPADRFEIYIYNGSATGIVVDQPKILKVSIPEEETYRNGVVAPAGDMNGDGFGDFLAGNEWASGNSAMEGKAYVFYGSLNGPSTQNVIDNPESNFDARFGSAVAGVGDFNYDGFEDIIIGSPYQMPHGAAYVYFGSRNPKKKSYLKLSETGTFGWSVFQVGDLKGDGQNFLMAGSEFGTTFLYSFAPNLHGEFSEFSTDASTKGTRFQGLLQITNSGSVSARRFFVTYYLSDDGESPGVLIKRTEMRTLKAGTSKTLQFSYLSPMSISGKYIIVSIDADNEVTETDENDNKVIQYIK